MERLLQEIGLSAGEERAYRTLLKLGATTTGPLAKESALSRSKLYEILEKLSRKGFVSHYKQNNISYFRAAPPQRIMEYLDKKEATLKEQKDEFARQLPLLEKLEWGSALKQEAEVFEGMEGIRNVREQALSALSTKDIIYFFGNPASGHSHVLGYWDDWNDRRIKKRIEARIIYNQDAKQFGERRKKQAYTKVRYLPKKGPTHAWVEIYGDTVAIAMKEQTPMSIVIRNRLVAQSFRMYFSIIWDSSAQTAP